MSSDEGKTQEEQWDAFDSPLDKLRMRREREIIRATEIEKEIARSGTTEQDEGEE